jgi:hypothetical protein
VPIVAAHDGYKLWYDVVGDGPAIIMPARFRAEFAALATAFSDQHRVLRYKPRQVVGVMEPEPEAGGHWEPGSWTHYPLDIDITDLHTVADAAGVTDFVLAGYSGMAALAAFLAPLSHRAVGLMVGGFPLLASRDYWLGFEEGARAALIQAGLPDKAADHHIGRLLYREWASRNDTAALTAMTGPKILWYGSRDCEPDCRMYDFVGGAAIARTIRSHTEDLHHAGFDIIELDDHDHIAALADTDLIAPQLCTALAKAGW